MIKSSKMKREGHIARMREMRNAHKMLAGKPEGKRPLKIQMHTRKDNIKNGS
jgi:hypothetical protein